MMKMKADRSWHALLRKVSLLHATCWGVKPGSMAWRDAWQDYNEWRTGCHGWNAGPEVALAVPVACSPVARNPFQVPMVSGTAMACVSNLGQPPRYLPRLSVTCSSLLCPAMVSPSVLLSQARSTALCRVKKQVRRGERPVAEFGALCIRSMLMTVLPPLSRGRPGQRDSLSALI